MSFVRRSIRPLIACSALAMLAACGDDVAEDDVEEMTSASGEVLEGSISDAMLPIDEVRSRAPQAEIVLEGSGSGGAAASAPAAEAPADEAAVPEPAAEAEPVLDLPPE